MPNCPCANESATCVEAESPLSRSLDGGGCVNIGLTTNDTNSIDFSTNGSGELEADLIVSSDPDNILEVKSNGAYVPEPDILGPNDLKCESDEEGNPNVNSNLEIGCNGLRVRECDDENNGLWAPPALESAGYYGYDAAAFQYSPLQPEANVLIHSSTSSNGGDWDTNGYVMRTLPKTSKSATFRVENEWCYDASFFGTVSFGAGRVRFIPDDTWDLRFYGRIVWTLSSGSSGIQMTDQVRATAYGHGDGSTLNDVSVTIPTMPIRTRKLDPGEYIDIRVENVLYVVASGSNDVDMTGQSHFSLNMETILQGNHRMTNTNISN